MTCFVNVIQLQLMPALLTIFHNSSSFKYAT